MGILARGGTSVIYDCGETVLKVPLPGDECFLDREMTVLERLVGVPGVLLPLGYGRFPKVDEDTGPDLAGWHRLCVTVRAVHARGVIHCDIKPSNVFASGLLFDFGLAHGPGLEPLARAGYVVGTPGWVPPEGVRAEGPMPTVAWDIWQLGALLHWVVEGEEMVPGESVVETFRATVARDYRPIRPEFATLREQLIEERVL